MRPFLVFLVLVAFAGCGKAKFDTIPQLKVKSVNSKDISGNDVIVITITMTDKEGDFSSYFAVQKKISNCPSGNFTDSSSLYGIPADFIATGRKEGEVIVTLSKLLRGPNTCSGPGGSVKIDTAIYRFWTRDRAGHTSDTVATDQIIISN